MGITFCCETFYNGKIKTVLYCSIFSVVTHAIELTFYQQVFLSSRPKMFLTVLKEIPSILGSYIIDLVQKHYYLNFCITSIGDGE